MGQSPSLDSLAVTLQAGNVSMRCYCSLRTKERKFKFKIVQILDVLNTAASEGAGGKGRRERPDPVRRHTAVTCVCAAALAGLDTLARKFRGAQPSLTP